MTETPPPPSESLIKVTEGKVEGTTILRRGLKVASILGIGAASLYSIHTYPEYVRGTCILAGLLGCIGLASSDEEGIGKGCKILIIAVAIGLISQKRIDTIAREAQENLHHQKLEKPQK